MSINNYKVNLIMAKSFTGLPIDILVIFGNEFSKKNEQHDIELLKECAENYNVEELDGCYIRCYQKSKIIKQHSCLSIVINYGYFDIDRSRD